MRAAAVPVNINDARHMPREVVLPGILTKSIRSFVASGQITLRGHGTQNTTQTTKQRVSQRPYLAVSFFLALQVTNARDGSECFKHFVTKHLLPSAWKALPQPVLFKLIFRLNYKKVDIKRDCARHLPLSTANLSITSPFPSTPSLLSDSPQSDSATPLQTSSPDPPQSLGQRDNMVHTDRGGRVRAARSMQSPACCRSSRQRHHNACQKRLQTLRPRNTRLKYPQ